ncbi:MAG: hypothetical protein JXR07_03185 [Reichenbachiella sp.]
MAQPINWTLTARKDRQKILEEIFKRDGHKNECRKLAMLIRIHMKYISKYNFAGLESKFPGMRETTCGDYKLFYKIRLDQITITGIFGTKKISKKKK